MSDSLSEKEMPLVLIVEDHDDLVQYLTACLSGKYRLTIAKNGKEGLDSAVKNIPDIIVSDVMMPVMDGLEMVKKLKSDFRTSHIPIILLTAKADIESRLSGLEKGADAYLAKPFHNPELEVRIRKLIQSRRMLHERYKQIQFSTSKDPKLKVEDIFINNVNRLLISQLSNEKYGIPELCRDMSMSRTQLYRKFTALTGQSLGHYFKSLRISKAKQLLLNSDKNISEIAFEVGFNDAAYFSKAFKDNTGSSPSQFRSPSS
jgi:YesN/AraC family two-component response regulator